MYWGHNNSPYITYLPKFTGIRGRIVPVFFLPDIIKSFKIQRFTCEQPTSPLPSPLLPVMTRVTLAIFKSSSEQQHHEALFTTCNYISRSTKALKVWVNICIQCTIVPNLKYRKRVILQMMNEELIIHFFKCWK